MSGQGKPVVLVTGATDGVGRVVARRLGEAGLHVLAHGRDRERGEAVVQEIEAAGGRGEFFAADLASLAEVRRLAARVGLSQGDRDGVVSGTL
jgi:NAD(P)-dependent dehydrogenase (short-subunit alcohol dehydrogenase family)